MNGLNDIGARQFFAGAARNSPVRSDRSVAPRQAQNLEPQDSYSPSTPAEQAIPTRASVMAAVKGNGGSQRTQDLDRLRAAGIEPQSPAEENVLRLMMHMGVDMQELNSDKPGVGEKYKNQVQVAQAMNALGFSADEFARLSPQEKTSLLQIVAIESELLKGKTTEQVSQASPQDKLRWFAMATELYKQKMAAQQSAIGTILGNMH